jgi:hypothetical protein
VLLPCLCFLWEKKLLNFKVSGKVLLSLYISREAPDVTTFLVKKKSLDLKGILRVFGVELVKLTDFLLYSKL